MKAFLLSHKKKLLVLFVLLTWFWFSLSFPLFSDPTCTVIEDQDGRMLSAMIAEDGQWRFPDIDTVPEKFEQALLLFEDEYFYQHLGVNPVAIAKAFLTNLKHQKIKRGGSTISMQVIRLSRKGKQRTIFEKLIEIILATRLELSASKKEILNLYASHAPFGGNVVGLEAASWRYYGRNPKQLSWGEVATLAVLPNAPSLIYPGKNHEVLLKKRNRLLDKMSNRGILDSTSCNLAKEEPLPLKPQPINQRAKHILTRVINEGKKGQRIKTTINITLQDRITHLVQSHYLKMLGNDVHNACVVVMEVETGEVKAYVGNTNSKNGGEVDMITAPRSTGSILKPLLYASMLDDGAILPQTLVADIPTQFSGYTPKNFDKRYDGAVSADNALIRSLNVPTVRMLHQYGVKRFHSKLKDLKMSTITKVPDHYGLSIILGGAETTIEELVSIYGSMARTLNHYEDYNGKYDQEDYFDLKYEYSTKKKTTSGELSKQSIFNAASIYWTFNVLSYLDRPREEMGWEIFNSSRKIAWKTGTSFGHRDAWAVGVTPEYVVGVWVGNASGEGKPGLTGVSAAGPLLFSAFKKLPATSWFSTPYDELELIDVCSKSGKRMSQWCESSDSLYVPSIGLKTESCTFHKWIHLDVNQQYRVNSNCYPVDKMVRKSWFVLPPVWEWYYKSKNPNYETLPPFMKGCEQLTENMEIIYPNNFKELYLAKDLDGSTGKIVFEVAHRTKGIPVYWHIDENFVGVTEHYHKIEVSPSKGKHTLTVVDEKGEMVVKEFVVRE